MTFPVEIEYFGFKAALVRNILAFFFSFFVAAAIAWILGLFLHDSGRLNIVRRVEKLGKTSGAYNRARSAGLKIIFP